MKIAVYAIAKNESKFVERFMASCNGADGVYVLDTGSTDGTIEKLESLGADVGRWVTDDFRFDRARNISLDRVPANVDVCVCLDLDEVLPDDWRQQIEKSWTPDTTRLRYPFIWQHDPEIRYYADKIHSRHGCKWVKPVHEVLTFDRPEVQTVNHDLVIHHYPDPYKSRSSYLPLLELAVKEDPNCDRSAHYLGREYMFQGQHYNAMRVLEQHLSLPSATWDAERCASMRFISQCYLMEGITKLASYWAAMAVIECPNTREPWMQVIRVAYKQEKWQIVRNAAEQLLKIDHSEKGKHYITDPEAWGWMPFDYLAIARYKLGDIRGAEATWMLALHEKMPSSDRDRIVNNLSFCHPKVA